MQTFTAQDLSGFTASSAADSLADASFKRCTFFNCCAVPPASVNSRPVFARILLERCSQWNCAFHGAVFEDVSLDGLKRLGPSPLFLWGCVFRRVTLRGRIAAPRLNPTLRPVHPVPADDPWRLANARFYVDSDWALDIREAIFGALLDFPDVPPSLVRRDPVSQVVITRERALARNWRGTRVGAFAVCIEALLASASAAVVVAAGKASRSYTQDLENISELRSLGVAEPD